MAIKERKQVTGTTTQINAYAGHEGQLVWDKTKKKLVGMSGTAGTNYPMASESHTHVVADVDGLQTVLNTINGKIPTKTSQLTNDSGFLKTHPKISVAANTLAPGSVATVTKSGTDAAPVFTFGIPKGADGAKGDRGDPGPQGPQGPAGSSAPTPRAYVTSAWRGGAQWYRRWSDGWLEQGGRLTLKVPVGEVKSFSLPTAFSNAAYTTVVTCESGYGAPAINVNSQTTSSVTVTGSGTSTSYYEYYVHFYCSGY